MLLSVVLLHGVDHDVVGDALSTVAVVGGPSSSEAFQAPGFLASGPRQGREMFLEDFQDISVIVTLATSRLCSVYVVYEQFNAEVEIPATDSRQHR